MRKLEFKGFLEQYLTDLSLCGSCAITKLEKELPNHPRLREPLTLYVTLYRPEYAAKETLLQEARNELQHYRNLVAALQAQQLPHDYQKVFQVYQNRIRRYKIENETKRLLRSRVLELQAKHSISNYAIYKGLGLNPGNVNDFLKNGSVAKLSLSTAYKVYDFVNLA